MASTIIWASTLFLICSVNPVVSQQRAKRCDDCVNFGKELGQLSNETSATNYTIDWNEVEKNFSRTLPDDDVFQNWDSMESNLQKGMRDLLRAIFPKVVALSTDAKVSGNCSAGILKWIVGLRHSKKWAMQMLDAIGKPTSGILEGAITMFGNYDQCLKIRVFHDDEEGNFDDYESSDPVEPKEFFRGQYCVAEIKPWLPKKPRFYGMNTVVKTPTNYGEDSVFTEFTRMATFFHFLTFRVDLCMPSTCSKDDMQQIGNLLAQFAQVRSKVLRCEIAADDSAWDLYTLAIATLVTLFVALIFVATFVQHRLLALIKNFSLFHSVAVFFTNSSQPVSSLHLLPVNGVRVLIMFWIVLIHSMIVVDFQFFREMQWLKMLATRFSSQLLTNSMFQFECFILISAFIFGYSNIDSLAKSLVKYLVKRYLKISSLIVALMVITCALPLVMPAGPVTADFLPKQVDACLSHGWKNVFFVQNFYQNDCLPQSWIFCVEFQLFLLALPLFYLFKTSQENSTRRTVFWLCLPLLLIVGFLYNFIQVASNHYPPSYFWTLPDKEQRTKYNYDYFYKPWAHLSTFAIGFYGGLLRRISLPVEKSFITNKNFILFGNATAIAVIGVFIFGVHDWIMIDLPDALTSALYAASLNIFASAAFTWLLYSLSGDMKQSRADRSAVIKVLNSNVVQNLSKLTTSAFLCVPLIQTILLASQQQHLYSSPLLMVYVLLGNTIFIYGLSFVLSVTIEIPVAHSFQSVLTFIFSKPSAPSAHQDKPAIETIESSVPTSVQTYRPDIELPMCKSKL